MDNIRISLGIRRILTTKLFLLYDAINIASTSETYSINLNNNPLEVNIPPTPLSGVETEADTGLILTI